ncbi:MAG: beta-galactosidase, partial [Planctomycetaceae bacterium]|nr:beta-galactosidase [Planctomycetaceae bacterium]
MKTTTMIRNAFQFSILTLYFWFPSDFVVAQSVSPAPIDKYPIHADDGLIYNPLYREVVKTGQLNRYDLVPTQAVTIRQGDLLLEAKVPHRMTAYDIVPIPYKLSWKKETPPAFPVSVEAVAFEEEHRRLGRDLFDLALPGDIDLDVEFLGSITAHTIPDAKHQLKADFSDAPKEYPGFYRKPMARSSVIEAGDLVWFRFRVTNTGNTILDANGYGACQYYPILLRKNDSDDNHGEFVQAGTLYNLYYRDVEDLYPGESREIWFHMPCSNPGYSERFEPSKTPQGFGIGPGEYKIQVRLCFRDYRHQSSAVNYWDGPVVFNWEMPFTVENEARQEAIIPGVKIKEGPNAPDKRTRWIHTMEEFMTSFDNHLQPPADGATEIEGTLWLQGAPWTDQVVLKLISGEPELDIKTVAIPIEMETESLSIEFYPNSAYTIERNGLKVPVVLSQCMADMRTNVQHSPFPEQHIRSRMREMKEHGINVMAMTSMPWLYTDMHNPKTNYQGDAFKYALEAAREEGIWIEGWGQYPFDRPTIKGIAGWISGKDFSDMATSPSGYPNDSTQYISHVEPRLPEANAVVVDYHFARWGDLFYQSASSPFTVPISVGEDTRGWMRDDINVRYPLGELGTQQFREWLQKKYENIDTLNKQWGQKFASFEEIQPETGQVDVYGARWAFGDPAHPFYEWNAACTDLDQYRTEVRVRNYRDTLAALKSGIPHPKVVLRTEGANLLVSGIDPGSPNSHFRHVYYSQRRLGAVAEILADADVLAYHSDYTTMPYTPSELREM